MGMAANFGRPPSLIIYAKIQPQGILRSGEEAFKRFLPYMGMVVNFGRPTSPMIYAKIQPQGILSSEEEAFKRFLPYMGMAAILVSGPQPF